MVAGLGLTQRRKDAKEGSVSGRIEWHRDFATLFKWHWFRDFPTDPAWAKTDGRATWTQHIAHTVQSCASLLGLYCRFEEMNKTDGVLWSSNGLVALLEWEWSHGSGASDWRHELKQLRSAAESTDHRPEFCGLFFYPPHHEFSAVMEEVERAWVSEVPLLAIAITNDGASTRTFRELVVLEVRAGDAVELHRIAAVPVAVTGTRWASGARL